MSVRIGEKIISGLAVNGKEIGDIGIAPFGIDETKNLRRYLNGQVISQTQFVAFANLIKQRILTNPSIATTEENWQSEVSLSKLGQCGKFVIDDTLGTIRLPKVVNINGLQDLSLMGSIKNESLPNISGGINRIVSATYQDVVKDGVFSSSEVPAKHKNAPQNGNYWSEDLNIRFDASLSSSTYQDNAPVQQEAILYPYFIQVATGSEEEVNITNEIQLNNPFSLLDYKWSEYELTNASWLISNGLFHSGATYPAVYDLLLRIYNGTETKEGVSVKLSTEAYEDTDFVLNTADTTFRLPIKVLLASGMRVAGNGMTLGFTDGTREYGVSFASGSAGAYLSSDVGAYGQTIPGTSSDTTYPTNNTLMGITLDPTKSGIETSSQDLYLYFYVGETIQDANIIATSHALTKLANTIDRTLTTDRETVVGWGMPDYSAVITGISFPYTAPSDGIISFNIDAYSFILKINSNTVNVGGNDSGNEGPVQLPLSKGDVATNDGLYHNLIFIPFKGV